jgi:hypothetical protein
VVDHLLSPLISNFDALQRFSSTLFAAEIIGLSLVTLRLTDLTSFPQLIDDFGRNIVKSVCRPQTCQATICDGYLTGGRLQPNP